MADQISAAAAAAGLTEPAAAALRAAAVAAAATLRTAKPTLGELVAAQNTLHAAAMAAGVPEPPPVRDLTCRIRKTRSTPQSRGCTEAPTGMPRYVCAHAHIYRCVYIYIYIYIHTHL